MTNYIATVIDTSGIQSYIFGSNRLRENIGASYLVNQATGAWVEKALGDLSEVLSREITNQCNIHIPTESDPLPKIHQDPQIVAELVYTGGGNAIAIFQAHSYAKMFTQLLSKRVLIEAPGLTLTVSHQEFSWDEEASLFRTIQGLRHKLEYSKSAEAPSSPLLGLSVTADCISTRLVAVGVSNQFDVLKKEDSYLVSREVAKKLEAIVPARDRLRRELENEISEDLYFPMDFDDLGRSRGESSYIAVVHADGNSMGERFKQCGEGKSNVDYVTAIRRLSSSVNNAGINALRSVTTQLVSSIQDGKVAGTLDKFSLPVRKEGGYYLPFRPLVYGGDDVTFVCDGRLGLELAALYLEAVSKEKDSEHKPFSACAGVAIVKTHYPFARAYDLSEALCGSAKNLVREETKPVQQSAMDWHIATSGLFGSIREIRQREYQSDQKKNLVMRPVWLSHQNEWRTWEGFKQVTQSFVDGDWKERKNKVIALREVLRQGKEAVKQFLNVYKIDHLPTFPIQNGIEKTLRKSGWDDEHCGYFDAIEAMDFYLDITGRES
jgi:hypothetical protein